MKSTTKNDTSVPRFINRELSWLEFNRRVLGEGQNNAVPLMERLKFLAIVGSNFDEFFMVRVATIRRQMLMKQRTTCPTGMTPQQQLRQIHSVAAEITDALYHTLEEDVFPRLSEAGLQFCPPEAWTVQHREFVHQYFTDEVEPLLTPVRVELPGEDADQDVRYPVPNLRLHVAVLLRAIARDTAGDTPKETPEDKEHIALVQVPSGLQRLIMLPQHKNGPRQFTFLEHVVAQEVAVLFPGYEVLEHCVFRLTRDADMGVNEERDEDFLEAMEQLLDARERSGTVRLVVDRQSKRLRKGLTDLFQLNKQEVYPTSNLVDLSVLMDVAAIDGFEQFRDEPWRPIQPPAIDGELPVWQSLDGPDVMVHYPYESMDVLLRFLNEAAEDPDTLAIKITLYRTSAQSPVVRALERAAEAGKQVTVLVEVKARFDEERNITVIDRLERAGAIVVHGVAQLKVHAKALLVIRRNFGSIRRYVYLSTGNFNERTAALYGDIGLFSSRADLCHEVGLFFNSVTGYSVIPGLRQLVMAPQQLRTRIIEMIQREERRVEETGRGLIMAKMNSLADPQIIEALYHASGKGVSILLNVRGICMLVPGISGVSENIQVVSIVDRYLEHGRIFYFQNGNTPEMWIGSADWMPRNLDRRVELLVPIENSEVFRDLKSFLELCFADTVKAQKLDNEGRWKRVLPTKKNPPLRLQEEMHRLAMARAAVQEPENRERFRVRRRNEGVE